jgi:predicted ester cyclase
MGMPPSGRGFRAGAISILRLDNGKIVEGWGEQDQLGLMRQLSPPPPPAPRP